MTYAKNSGMLVLQQNGTMWLLKNNQLEKFRDLPGAFKPRDIAAGDVAGRDVIVASTEAQTRSSSAPVFDSGTTGGKTAATLVINHRRDAARTPFVLDMSFVEGEASLPNNQHTPQSLYYIAFLKASNPATSARPRIENS
jgi:hypothetical protein